MDIYFQPDLSQGVNELTEEESRHCIKVLRHKVGDIIIIVDGNGLRVKAKITDAHHKHCKFSILEKEKNSINKAQIHIAITPTKSSDRIEWFAEKATEIGINHIDLYFSSNSERRKVNIERVSKKAVSAMKQSGQSYLPEVTGYKDFKSLLKAKEEVTQKFIAYVDFENQQQLIDLVEQDTSAIVLIGPEGDFSQAELQLALDSGYRKVSLGKNRLRTETAGLAACHILNLANR